MERRARWFIVWPVLSKSAARPRRCAIDLHTSGCHKNARAWSIWPCAMPEGLAFLSAEPLCGQHTVLRKCSNMRRRVENPSQLHVLDQKTTPNPEILLGDKCVSHRIDAFRANGPLPQFFSMMVKSRSPMSEVSGQSYPQLWRSLP